MGVLAGGGDEIGWWEFFLSGSCFGFCSIFLGFLGIRGFGGVGSLGYVFRLVFTPFAVAAAVCLFFDYGFLLHGMCLLFFLGFLFVHVFLLGVVIFFFVSCVTVLTFVHVNPIRLRKLQDGVLYLYDLLGKLCPASCFLRFALASACLLLTAHCFCSL